MMYLKKKMGQYSRKIIVYTLVIAMIGILVITDNLVRVTATDGKLLDGYLEGKGGSLTVAIMNTDFTQIPLEDGVYNVTVATPYYLRLDISASQGIEEGDYIYRLPAGVSVPGAPLTEQIYNSSIVIGTYTIGEDGEIKFHFNNNANTAINLKVSAGMNVLFANANTLVDFDDIRVKVNLMEELQPGVYKAGAWFRSIMMMCTADTFI